MNVLKFFQESKQILAICPCCGQVFRLSDGQLFTKERPQPSPFDRIEAAEQRLARERETFEAKKAALREQAVAKGQRAAQARLKAIARPFVSRRIDPQDVKVVFHPVEFIVFRGMTAGEVDQLVFIDRLPESRERERVQASMGAAIKAGNYDWKLLRISAEGMVSEE